MAKSKCLKRDWIELNDFIKKYYGLSAEASIKNKRDVITRTIKKFDKDFIEKVNSAVVVHERTFCTFRHLFYKESED